MESQPNPFMDLVVIFYIHYVCYFQIFAWYFLTILAIIKVIIKREGFGVKLRKGCFLLLLTCFFCLLAGNTFAASGIQVQIDQRNLQMEVPPQEVNGRVLVPLRAIFEGLGALRWIMIAV